MTQRGKSLSLIQKTKRKDEIHSLIERMKQNGGIQLAVIVRTHVFFIASYLPLVICSLVRNSVF